MADGAGIFLLIKSKDQRFVVARLLMHTPYSARDEWKLSSKEGGQRNRFSFVSLAISRVTEKPAHTKKSFNFMIGNKPINPFFER